MALSGRLRLTDRTALGIAPRGRAALTAFVVLIVAASLRRLALPPPQRPSPAPPAGELAQASPGTITSDLFELKAHPDAMVLHARDPATLTESERKFGVAPRRDPAVEYQPGVILMEHGDQAIRAIASDLQAGADFDAHAPQVADFSSGKIVFATGFAVGGSPP